MMFYFSGFLSISWRKKTVNIHESIQLKFKLAKCKRRERSLTPKMEQQRLTKSATRLRFDETSYRTLSLAGSSTINGFADETLLIIIRNRNRFQRVRLDALE